MISFIVGYLFMGCVFGVGAAGLALSFAEDFDHPDIGWMPVVVGLLWPFVLAWMFWDGWREHRQR